MSAPTAESLGATRAPVLIVGGGPTGLALALFLTRHGVRPLLVERRSGTGRLPRAFSLHARTMEIFRAAGVEQAVRDVSARAGLAHLRGILSVRTLAGDPGAWVLPPDVPTFDPSPLSPVGGICCPQDLYEPVLAEAAAEAGARIEFGAELLDFEDRPDAVHARIRSSDGRTRTVRAAYLVAADGAASPVRERSGVALGGRGALVGAAINVLFRADLTAAVDGRTFFMCTAFNPRASVALTPRDASGTWSMLGVALDDGKPVTDYTPERCVRLVRDAVGVADLPVEILRTVPWTSGMRVADRFRSGRVFLAGDAAHTMSPSGGYGANTGIQDAHNLAWKLAAVLHCWGWDRLLDSYDAERRPVAWAIAEQAALRTMTGHQGPGEGGLPAIRDDFTIIFGHQYDSAAVLGAASGEPLPERLDLTARPGTRAPHAERVTDGMTGATESVLDRLGRSFVVLTAGPSEPWTEAVQLARGQLGVPLDACRLDGDPRGGDAAVLRAYDLEPGGAILVRPDGFVAWRCDAPPVDAGARLTEALTRLLGRQTAPDDDTGPAHPAGAQERNTDRAR
ncbi:FAD-dependent oxidoreductase [Streptomyces sp. ODS05-4]|uniref:FAD-dependent oxidoreductase n=1 Tax=Streptomyces sp. ODS05-4 TaxID=2944939 RepID=UPI00210E283D|nr:FAD-dependent oxidoreductase [Streptomyces sp. ODS05-4]